MKRLVSLILALVLVIGLLPTAALAEEPETPGTAQNVSITRDGETTYYPSLMAAFADVQDGDTIVALDSYWEQSGYIEHPEEGEDDGLPEYATMVGISDYIKITLPEGRNHFTLALGECQLWSLYPYSFSGGAVTVTATGNGGMVIGDETGVGGDKPSGFGSVSGNELTVEGGVYTALRCDEGGKVTVRDANVIMLLMLGGEMDVQSGSFGTAQILVDNDPTFTLSGGSFSGKMFNGEPDAPFVAALTFTRIESGGDVPATVAHTLASVEAAGKVLANVQTQTPVEPESPEDMEDILVYLLAPLTVSYAITCDDTLEAGSEPEVRYTNSDGKLDMTVLPTPTAEDLMFDGWFTAPEGGNAVTADTVFSQNATIYAHWTDPSVPHTHDWGEGWVTVKEATTTQKGSKERVCVGCGYKETADIPRLSSGNNNRRPQTAVAQLPFTDVKTTDPYYESVKYVYEKKWMEGTSATTFAPEGDLTRAMLATVLYRAAGSPAVTGELEFTDAKADTWYSVAVLWAAQTGVLRGYGNGSFGPEDLVSVEMLNMVLARQKGEDPAWTGDPALSHPATRAEIAQALAENAQR